LRHWLFWCYSTVFAGCSSSSNHWLSLQAVDALDALFIESKEFYKLTHLCMLTGTTDSISFPAAGTVSIGSEFQHHHGGESSELYNTVGRGAASSACAA
jgi:hypothetical protein